MDQGSDGVLVQGITAQRDTVQQVSAHRTVQKAQLGGPSGRSGLGLDFLLAVTAGFGQLTGSAVWEHLVKIAHSI